MEGTYEYELERAELLGVEPISREAWEVQNRARLEAEVEQEKTEIAAELENEGESAKRTHGKMDELNNILSATQLKINKFKVFFFNLEICNIFKNFNFLDGLRKLHEFIEDSNCKSSTC